MKHLIDDLDDAQNQVRSEILYLMVTVLTDTMANDQDKLRDAISLAEAYCNEASLFDTLRTIDANYNPPPPQITLAE